MMTTLVIPIMICAVALVQLQTGGILDAFVQGFFALDLIQQLSLLALLFSVIFTAVTLVGSITTTSVGDHRRSKTNIQYPLDEIHKATTEMDKFKCVFPMLKQELLDYLQLNSMPADAMEWCNVMMEYNVPGGKLNRGTTVLSVQRTLHGGVLSDTDTARASVLGWAIEFLQAFFLVADDVMDQSKTRRGQPCWYQLPRVQLIAINDSFLLESFVFSILKTHFGSEPYYMRLLELFLSVIQKTEFGQLLDLTSQEMGSTKVDLTRFTLERYQKIVQFKTAYYTFYLPVAIGMITSGVVNAQAFLLAERICCTMGEYFQIQDDYLDCFGDPELIGKVGTDIQENKCSWLVVQALQRANEQQLKVIQDNYGVWNDGKVKKIKGLYVELELPALFLQYEEDSYAAIQAQLDQVQLMPRGVFELLLHKIYKRSK